LSPRTLTAAPTDRRYWKRLLRCVHPDHGGDAELFVWVRELQQHVAGDDVEPPRREYEPPRRRTTQDSPRVDYTNAFDKSRSFEDLTRQAVAMAGQVQEPYASVLRLLDDCHEVAEVAGPTYRQQFTGASYRSLAAIAHRAGMTKTERVQWYRICEQIPLAQRHAGHLMMKLQREAA
jgi:hypothetical protein